MSERIRFYLDENVNSAVAMGLRRRGMDVMTTVEAQMLGAEDEEHLARATSEGRVLFTQDTDFIRIHAQGVSHSGIVYFSNQTDIGRIVTGLHFIYEVYSSTEMIGRLEYL